MKKKSIKLFAILSIIIYILAIAYFAFNLTKEYISSSSTTKNIFDTCVNNIKLNLPDKKPGTQAFDDSLNNCFSDLHDFSYIEVYINGETVYKYQINEHEDGSESRMIKPYFCSFKIQNDNYFITANLYKLKPYSIYFNSRIAFLIILIVTILALVMIIVFNNSAESVSSEVTEDYDDEDDEIDNKDTNDISDNISEDKIIVNEEENSNNPNIITENTIDNSEQNDIAEENSDIEEFGAFKNNNENLTVLPSDDVKPSDLNTSNSNSEELFSTVTGLGLEKYLITRLNSEINRAISSEFDLSLFVIKITNISRNSDTVKNICDHLITLFQFKDLLFEYKEDCIAAIKISMNIDDAISFADNIYAEINEILKDSFAKCYIGISSKTIRMISGERLLKEADEALSHAESTPDSPIIGFRADAEKFRKYFENK